MRRVNPTPAPGLILAALRSGAGKTTLALGVMRALTRQGLSVAPVKCGPDYIDPAFHAAATGLPSFNLDAWAMDEALISHLASRAAEGADLVIAEGAMGLFDGRRLSISPAAPPPTSRALQAGPWCSFSTSPGRDNRLRFSRAAPRCMIPKSRSLAWC